MDEGRRGRGRPEGEREGVGECEKERNGGGRKGREGGILIFWDKPDLLKRTL